MTEKRAEPLVRGGRTPDVAGGEADQRIRLERQSIGKQLHQGILQELTVAGLRLKVLQDAAPPPAADAIAEFSQWLRQRQAELRQVVSRLEQGEAGSNDAVLAAIVADLNERYGCAVALGRNVPSGRFEPEIWSAMTGTIADVARLLAQALSASRIGVDLPNPARPTLQMTHDGERLIGHPEQLALLRAIVGRGGASLEIEPQGEGESLTLDWAS
jgi:signal transduction histidine kinase